MSQEVGLLTQDVSRMNAEVANSRFLKEEELRFRDKIDGLNQENIKLRMIIDDL